MDQSALHCFLMRVARHIHFLHRGGVVAAQGGRIQAGVVHAGGNGAGRRVEVLHLLGHIAQVADVFGKGDRVLHGAARVGGHEVGHDVLVFSELLIHLPELAAEGVVDIHGRLAHFGQDVVRNVLRRDAKLAAYVVLAELAQEGTVLICQKIVEPET